MRPFTYTRARSAHEAVTAFATSTADRPHYLSGGTALIDLMKLSVETPGRIIDLTDVPDLDFVREEDGDLIVGALTRMSDVANHPLVGARCPALVESLRSGASQQLRNMARVGGNLLQRTRCGYFRSVEFPCNKRQPGSGCSALGGLNRGHAILGGSDHCIAVYPSDWAVALTAFDASVAVVGPNGTRSVSIHDLIVPPGDTPDRETTLAPGELITAIRVPTSPAARSSTYRKVGDRSSYAFALASAAVGLHLDAAGAVGEVRIALGGLGTVPWRAWDAERALVGARLDDASVRAALEPEFRSARTTAQNAFRVGLGVETVVEAVAIAKESAS
ncbi:xanthine dehydrogenase family protein subunit M [Micromonospora sp. WMMA1363]|uniref:FAD binding domain-containing protein n=1 Tax=Micromonospora sp. WMMA1363 TaxID=3053985 RepID=UPI00259CA981|nr:xanthine dehydrogenase family protein subunit M [Micromonospora sp. WMMA1363]MDM4719538.1 xanthine dehydrogenase family protein subunit M [Micromonospora sp. WMMA1363]